MGGNYKTHSVMGASGLGAAAGASVTVVGEAGTAGVRVSTAEARSSASTTLAVKAEQVRARVRASGSYVPVRRAVDLGVPGTSSTMDTTTDVTAPPDRVTVTVPPPPGSWQR
jgi:hypothetical protein